jgi:hypothetical protein
MASTHVGDIKFTGESGKEGLMYEYTYPGLVLVGYKLLHTETMPANFTAGNKLYYEYTTQSGDGENWVTVNSITVV